MKITRLGRSRPLVSITSITGGTDTGSSGSVITSTGSNGETYWGPNVAVITSNSSNTLTGPFVNFASGTNVAFGVSSNTLTISSAGLGGGGTVEFVGVRAYAGATTSLTDNTWTSIALNSERFDTSAFHDNSTNNSRLTVPSGKAGYYLIGANGQIAANTTGSRGLRLWLNNTTRIAEQIDQANASGSIPYRAFVSSLYSLVAGDYVEMQMWQNSTGTISTENTANSTCELWMYRVG